MTFPGRTRFALSQRLNLLLAESGATTRVIRARNPAERATLGDYFLVDAHKRHIIVRDHVDLDRFADEISALQKSRGQPGNALGGSPGRWRTTGPREHSVLTVSLQLTRSSHRSRG
jgi:hypothetical protein